VVADIEIDGAILVVHIPGADSRVVIGVEDPPATAAAINAALGRS